MTTFSSKANSLITMDPEVFSYIDQEKKRQQQGIELIASENYCSYAVMKAQGSVLTNKYAEGYPGKRYYDGCEYVDLIEQLAIDRLKKLFNVEYANVQPHSGSSANMAIYMSMLNPGDKVLGMDLSQGGHLTHGSPVNFSGKIYNMSHYGLNLETERIDYDQIRDLAKKERPKMIIAGASAYPRIIDFKTFGEIAREVDAYFMADIAHIAGLIAAGLHPSPVGHADFITSTTHKTLRGPRGGIIMSNQDMSKKMNSSIFPGIQGGPLEHVIAAKAVAFKEALEPSFIDYQKQVLKNAKAMSKTLISEGIELVTGGTDNHLILFKTNSLNLSGKEASILLENVGITCNKNMIPQDTRSPFVTSGVRIGTPAITTRGFKESDCQDIAILISKTLKNPKDEVLHKNIHQQVLDICSQYPIYP